MRKLFDRCHDGYFFICQCILSFSTSGINTSGVSVDGMDLCYQTNFLGHFLLTRLLLKSLLKAKNFYASGDDVEAGRVVNLSSVTHHFSGCNEARNGGQYFNSSRKHDKKWWNGKVICFTYTSTIFYTYFSCLTH